MKILPFFLVFYLCCHAVPGLSYDAGQDGLVKVLNKDNADRLLLLAFTDRTINSINSTAAPNSYRKRGNYRTSTWSKRVTDQIAEEYRLEKLAEWPMTEVGMHCVVYQMSANSAASAVIDQLSKDKRVELVQNMHYFNTQASGTDPYFKLQGNLKDMQIEKAHQKAQGRGVTVGVIDTGIDLSHPDLEGQIAKNINLVPDLSPSFNTDKHGTAVAGVIAAKGGNANGIIGIAPNAQIEALKACWPEKQDDMKAICNSFSLALAINTALRDGIDILNMSLSGPEDPLLAILINKAINKGMIVVAAGNDSPNGTNNFPASMKNVISVQSSQSNASASDTIIAYGNQVLTTLPHGTYDFISGHSIATAEVSGIIALLLELKPRQTAAGIHRILADALTKNPQSGAMGINVNAALDAVCEASSCPQQALTFVSQHFLPN